MQQTFLPDPSSIVYGDGHLLPIIHPLRVSDASIRYDTIRIRYEKKEFNVDSTAEGSA